MIDIHSHLLPGIDDGPPGWGDSLALCRLLARDGVHTAVATPHVIDDVYDNTRGAIVDAVAELNRRLAEVSIPLTVVPGGEVHMTCDALREPPHDDLPTLNGSRYLLLEVPSTAPAQALGSLIFSLIARGTIPIIAHPERCKTVQDSHRLAAEWAATGCYLQIDAESVLGLWGGAAATCARRLIEAGLAHALASDAHSCEERPPRLHAAAATVAQWAGADMAAYLVDRAPAQLISGCSPGDPPPRPATRPQTWLQRLGLAR